MDEYRVTLDKGGLDRDFVFVGGPLDAPHDMSELLRALGLASAQWARLEQHIDALLLHVNNQEHSAALFDSEHPVGFLKKIKLLKRWFNQHPALHHLTAEIRTLTPRLKELNQHRNNLIHGSIESWEPISHTCVMRTLKFNRDGTFSLSTHAYTVGAINTVAELTEISNRYLSTISRVVFTKDALAQLRTP